MMGGVKKNTSGCIEGVWRLAVSLSIDKGIHLLYIKHTFFLVWYPSGKGLVCKTIIGRFDSYPHLLWRVPAIPQDAEGLGSWRTQFV